MTSSSAEQKLSLRALIALVVGSMVGSGIFAVPSAFGRATGGLGALIAWTIAGVGMLMLAFVFQTLARRKPELRCRPQNELNALRSAQATLSPADVLREAHQRCSRVRILLVELARIGGVHVRSCSHCL